jgi:hypothetical protein
MFRRFCRETTAGGSLDKRLRRRKKTAGATTESTRPCLFGHRDAPRMIILRRYEVPWRLPPGDRVTSVLQVWRSLIDAYGVSMLPIFPSGNHNHFAMASG